MLININTPLDLKSIEEGCLIITSDTYLLVVKVFGTEMYNLVDLFDNSIMIQHERSLEELLKTLDKDYYLTEIIPKNQLELRRK